MGLTLSKQILPETNSSFSLIPLHIIQYLDWSQRLALLNRLNRMFLRMATDDKYFRWLCFRLANEHGVYVPFKLPTSLRNWRNLFQELYCLKDMWNISLQSALNSTENVQEESVEGEDGEREEEEAPFKWLPAAPQKTDRCNISVYARFRPYTAEASKESIGTEKGTALSDLNENPNPRNRVVLPLHQKLSLIRMANKDCKTNGQALRVLAQEGGWFYNKYLQLQEKRSTGGNEDNKENDVQISVQKKNGALINNNSISKLTVPGKDELQDNNDMIEKVESVDSDINKVVMLTSGCGLREFTYDGVLPIKSNQNQTYDLICRRLVMDFLNGYNCSIIAYGQTGSGKTYSMLGDDTVHEVLYDDSARGLIPRACEEVLQCISADNESRNFLDIKSRLKISYVEIYGNLVSDLLDNGTRVGHSKVASQSFVLSGAVEHSIESLEELYKLLKKGDMQKKRAATAMNDRSSRAHSLLILSLTQTRVEDGNEISRNSKLFLSDLGGSEQVKKSGVDTGKSNVTDEENEFSTGFQQGDRLKEAVNINLGLLALKKVIKALNDGNGAYCPYQDSKLTMLLSSGLGGDCKTSILVTSSMDPIHASETVSTLRFGESCAQVENTAQNQASLLEGVLRKLNAEISALEQSIIAKETWEMVDETRVDTLAEEGTFEHMGAGGVEVKKVAVLKGAEKERAELETLLKKRLQLTGSTMDGFEDEEHLKNLKKKKAVGFGKGIAKMYGVGEAFDEEEYAKMEDERFINKVDVNELAAVVRAKGGGQWNQKLEKDPKKLEALAKKVNRNKLVYSGMSA